MSEPQHIGEILPQVLRDIKGRCNRYRRERSLPLIGSDLSFTSADNEKRRKKVLSAVGSYLSGKGKRKRRSNKESVRL